MAQKFTVPITIKNLTTSGSDGITVFLDQETYARLKIEAGGRITWGDGSGAGDTNLYRSEANVLTTDDLFEATGGLVTITSSGSPEYNMPDGALAIDSINNIFYFRSGGIWNQVTGGGGATLTVSDSMPTEELSEGDLWFESDSGKTFVYYDSFWVEIGNALYGGASLSASVNFLEFPSDIIPQTTNVYSLGSPTHKWQEVYVGPGSLYIEDAETGLNNKFTVSNGVMLVNNEPLSASIGTNSVMLGTHTTGSYVRSLVAGTGVTLSNNSGESATPTIAIGQAVGTTSNVTFNDVVVSGTLTVSGSTTTVNTETLSVADNIITLNSDVTTGAPTQNSGIEVLRGSSPTVSMRWNESLDKWEFTNDGTSYNQIPISGAIALGTDTTGNYMSGVTGGTGVTVTHTPGEGSSATIAIGQAVGTSSSVEFAAVTAPLIGNASTATTLQTARTISLGGDLSGSASFNGGSNITIAATVQPDSVALGTDTTGNYMVNVSASTGISVSHTQGEGSTATISLNANLDNLTDVIVSGVTDKQLLVYDTATSQWKNADAIVSSGLAYKAGFPASKTSTGTLGQISIDGANGTMYVCTGTNTWQKISLNSANFTNVGGFA